jgi:hypothetical protein
MERKFIVPAGAAWTLFLTGAVAGVPQFIAALQKISPLNRESARGRAAGA